MRSGSKIGGKYKGMIASTNDAFAPTLRGLVKSELGPEVNAVLEIVIDGETSQAVADAMRAGISAVARLGPDRGALRISAGNYGGKLGKFLYHLKDLRAVKALTFTLIAEPPERLDLSPLTPERLAGLDKASIARLRLGQSKRAATVGDVFRFAGSELDTLVFDGGSARFDLVGAGMTAGSIHVIGDVGAQAGRRLHGGTIRIDGSAGPHAGSAMRGGRLEIAGNAGDDLAAPLAGELAGMAGGVLVVHGRAGARAGDRMRRGLVAVLRGAGEHAGCRMVAGTLVVAGGAGPMPGMLMRRGSILLDRAPAALQPELRRGRRARQRVRAAGRPPPLAAEGITRRPLFAATPRRFGGDNAVLGLGELMFPRD